MKPDTSACWGAAKRGYCSIFDALVNNYALNSTQVSTAAARRASLQGLTTAGHAR